VNATWYDVLGVEPTASTDEIRAAWRLVVADLDPTDRRFRVANQAAEVLLDPERRAEYDAGLPAEEPPPESQPETSPEQGLAPSDDPDRTTPVAPPEPPEREAAASPQAPGGRRPDLVALLIIALAGLTAVALGYVGFALTRPSPEAVAGDTTAAQAAAERAVVPILSYDAHHLDESQAAATPYLTQDYRAQYDKLFAVIRDNAPKTGTVVRAKYLASGIVRSGFGRVDVLVFVNQVTFNKQHPKTPVIYKNQATVTMEKVGNDWLVDNMVTSQQGS
jgi:Mce-associated membrane protein